MSIRADKEIWGMANEDKVAFWKMADFAVFGEIKKQIEEKLK